MEGPPGISAGRARGGCSAGEKKLASGGGGRGSLGRVGSGPLRERLLGRALGEAGPSVCGWKRAQAV